jgi:glycosyltransferase involved in cell wall biosynthesis
MTIKSKAKSRHLLHIFPTFAVGGSQIRFSQLVKLHGSRYRHTVISLDGVQSMAANIPPAMPVELYPFAAQREGKIVQAIDLLDLIKPDVLVSYNWGSFDWWVARKFRSSLRHVHIEDGFGPDERDRQLLRRSLARRLVLSDSTTAIVLPSKTLWGIAQESWWLPLTRLHYIPNGLDWRRFQTDHSEKTRTDEITIGTVATLRREKNIIRLISLYDQVAALRPSLQIKLLIVGDGPEFSAIAQQVQRSSNVMRITMAGATRNPEKFLEKMDIFALTSDTEQMPLSVLEAMAAGLPVVSFNVGDVSDMVSAENRSAASIRRDDDAGFVNQLVALIDDRQMRIKLGFANFAAVKVKFDAEKMAQSYATLFG